MCCLRYEHEFYVQQRKRFPKEGRVVRTSRGDEKVIANDIFRERVTLRGADGEVRLLGLEDLRVELDTAGTGALYPQVAADELFTGSWARVQRRGPGAALVGAVLASGYSVLGHASYLALRPASPGGFALRAGRERGENGSDSGGAAPQDA